MLNAHIIVKWLFTCLQCRHTVSAAAAAATLLDVVSALVKSGLAGEAAGGRADPGGPGSAGNHAVMNLLL